MKETKIDDGVKDLLDDNLNANNFRVALKTLSVLFVQFSSADVVLRESVTEEIGRFMIKMSLVHVCLFPWKIFKSRSMDFNIFLTTYSSYYTTVGNIMTPKIQWSETNKIPFPFSPIRQSFQNPARRRIHRWSWPFCATPIVLIRWIN